MVFRKRNFSLSEHLEGSRYSSDIFAMIGTVLLWIYWPSFNAILAHNDGYHRAIINTYISLLGSTISTFIVSSFFGQ
jgi:ammonium transporter Rh